MSIPIDENGYIPVRNRLLSKAGVFPYLGSSIGASEPNRIYMVYRPESELSNEETINSFKLLPLIDDHEMLGTDATPAEKKGVQGTTGEEIYYDKGLYGNLKVFSESLKNLIEGGKKELSLGYKCKYIFESGVFEGQKYDAIQTNLRGNHIALVDEGRMGKEVSVIDAALKTVVTMDRNDIKSIGDNIMNEEQFKALLDALGAVSSKLDTLIKHEENEKTEEKVEVSDEEIKDETKVEDEEVKEEVKVEDEEIEALKKENETLTKKVEDMKGMDEKIKKSVMQELAQRDKLAAKLSPIIGSFDHLEMDLKGVVSYGLKKLDLTADKGQEMATLNGYLAATKSVKSNGMDSNVQKNENVSFDIFK